MVGMKENFMYFVLYKSNTQRTKTKNKLSVVDMKMLWWSNSRWMVEMGENFMNFVLYKRIAQRTKTKNQ